MKNLLTALFAVAIFALPFGASADFINDGDYQGVGSRVGVDTPQNPEDCDVQTEVHDGDVCVPASADGGDGGGDSGAGDSGPGDSGPGDSGPGDSGEGEGEGEGEGQGED